jgi:hypothetical protein
VLKLWRIAAAASATRDGTVVTSMVTQNTRRHDMTRLDRVNSETQEQRSGNDAPPRTVTVRNMSPQTVIVRAGEVCISLSPLGERLITDASLQEAIESMEASPYLETYPGTAESDELAAVIFGLTFWGALIGAIVVAFMTEGMLPVLGYITVCVVIAIVVWRVKKSSSWSTAVRWAREKMTLLLVIVVGFGIPATVLLFATQLFDQLRESPGNALDAPLNRVVTFRLLQALFLGIATTFPALLYFLFDRQNTDTLRTRFLLALFRLDRRLKTAADWQAKYGRQVGEAFGTHPSHGASRVLRAHRAPVVVATAVIAFGWVLAFLNLDAVSIDGQGEILADGSLLSLYEPERGVVAFGFLGAYFFGVNTVLRSYLRGDLRPKAYSQITARVLIVVVLSALVAITSFGDNSVVLAVAFFAGIVPDTVLQWIWEHARGSGSSSQRFDELQPLTELEGIDLYDRARLAEEGVTNVESLAHGDLVDLLLQTRIPPGRLVDWVDQAVLRLHLADDDNERTALRAMGVRTATDLLTTADVDATSLHTALDATDDPAKARFAVRLQALRDEEWVAELLAWRRNKRPKTVCIPDEPSEVVESTTVLAMPDAPTPPHPEPLDTVQAG